MRRNPGLFKATVLSKSKEDLIANDDTPMADKANGTDFMKKYIFAVALTLKKGYIFISYTILTALLKK